MDFPNKIQRVKEQIGHWLEEWSGNDGFSYPTGGFYTENEETGETTTVINEDEHREVVRYLASKGYLEIIEKNPKSIRILVHPESKPTIKLKTLELISRELKEHYTGTEIITLLKEAGVDKRFIIYPESKWMIFYKVFVELSVYKNTKDAELLFNLICNAIHPLNLDGNSKKSEELQIQFNEYLKYDHLEIYYINNEHKFVISDSMDSIEPSKEDLKQMELEYEERSKEELDYLKQSQNKDKISLLRKSYQSLMSVVELFCENPSQPTTKLNDSYKFIHQIIWETISELDLNNEVKIYTLANYRMPFPNLFSAEKVYEEKKKELSWQKIRPEMNAIYGDIEEIYKEVNGSDIIAEPNQQKKINDIQLYLSKLKEEIKDSKKQEKNANTPTTKVEITAIPQLEFKESKTKPSLKKISLKSVSITYDDDKANIQIGRQPVKLPPYKNEHYFCRVLFQRPKEEFIDWSIIFEDMDKVLNSVDKKDSERDKRMVQDTMYAVNNRIKEVANTDEDLFTWKEKSIRRNY